MKYRFLITSILQKELSKEILSPKVEDELKNDIKSWLQERFTNDCHNDV